MADQSEWLKHGRWVSGVEVVKVAPGRPGDVAGRQGSRPGVLQMALLMTGFIASAFFPPAMVGMIALSKAAEPHVIIIAVDGKRACFVIDFEEALGTAEAGEVVYLTVIRHDRRD